MGIEIETTYRRGAPGAALKMSQNGSKTGTKPEPDFPQASRSRHLLESQAFRR
jgi:hypothetical protein